MKQINVVFNCDSTLVTIEGPVELAKRKKIKQIEELTERAMSGEDSFTAVFRERFNLYRPTLDDINWLAGQYIESVVDDGQEVVSKIQELGHNVFIVSAGYRPAILKLAKHLKIPAHHVCAVDIEFDANGNYLACDTENILTTDAGIKIVLAEIAKSGPTIYVGDSVRDLDAKGVVDLFIGFGGVKIRPRVKKDSDIFIESLTLKPVLDEVERLIQKDLTSLNTTLSTRA